MKRFITFMLLCAGFWQTVCLAWQETRDTNTYDVERVKAGDLYYSLSSSAKVAKVTSSEDHSYAGSVVIPESVEYVGETYPVLYIGEGAFQGCEALTDVYMADGIRGMEYRAFHGCKNLSSVRISKEMSFIAGPVFEGCQSLSIIKIPDLAAWCGVYIYPSSGGVYGMAKAPSEFFNEASLCDDEGNVITELVIPEGITTVYNYVFHGCQSLVSVKIPESVASVGEFSFSGCRNLETVTFPNEMESIGWKAFYMCESLKEIKLPSSLKEIPEQMCVRCSSLLSLTLPENLESIGPMAFSGCTSLTTIKIPSSLKSFGMSAFSECRLQKVIISDLAAWCSISSFDGSPLYGAHLFIGDEKVVDLKIPDGVTTLPGYAFVGCQGLNSVDLNQVETIGEGTFMESDLQHVVASDCLREIGYSAFTGCNNLSTVRLSSNVNAFSEWAFYSCQSLKDVYYDTQVVPEIPKRIQSSVFLHSPIENATLHVPENMIEAFRTTVPWSGFGNITALLPEEIPNNYKEDDYAYRPFVEEGKRWVLGFYEDGADPAETQPTKIMNQYIEGDTIIDGQQWKQLWWSMEDESGHTVRGLDGYLYEKDQKVYIIYPLSPIIGFLHYDFSTPTGEQINFSSNSDSTNTAAICTIGKKTICESDTYKGVCTEILPPEGQDFSATWMQGVGYLGFFNISFADKSYCRLMSCTVGDEVLYYDASLMPKALEAKKKRLDFTHVIKAQPKAPQQGPGQEGTETLKGEYSPAELFVHLNGLAGTYSITLTDEAGKEVYAKEVLTDNVLALSTDLLTYAPGTYTLTVENEYEKFVTILNLTTDIASTPAPTQNKGALYDLSGRRLERTPQKGIYIHH